jgi:hypothetical protein
MAIQIQRREFIAALGGAAACPLGAWAQQPGGMRRIGVLMSLAEDDRQGQANPQASAARSARPSMAATTSYRGLKTGHFEQTV